MTKDGAIRATRNGAIAACVSGAMTIILMAIAIATDADGKLALFNDPLNLLDAALVFICAFGMYKHSRLAAIVIFIYFVAAKAIISVETGSYSGIGISIVFLYFFGKAIFGAFTYHRLEREANPDYRAVTWKVAILLGTGVLILTFAISFALFSTFGVIPSTRVLSGAEVPSADIRLLQENGVIASDDRIDFFYAQGLTSVLESGNILTKKEVILYYTDEQDQIVKYAIPINEVIAVDLEEAGTSISDSIYLVRTASPDYWIKLFLSIEQKGDEKFVGELRNRIN